MPTLTGTYIRPARYTEPLYATVIRGSDGFVWNNTAAIFEMFNPVHWTDYAISVERLPSGISTLNKEFSVLNPDKYYVSLYTQDGENPSTTDDPLKLNSCTYPMPDKARTITLNQRDVAVR